MLFQTCTFYHGLSKEIHDFNIDTILASTADQTPQEFELMQQFIFHERGLKAYDDRYEWLHVHVVFQKLRNIELNNFVAFVDFIKHIYPDVYKF